MPHQLSKQRPFLSAVDGLEWRIASVALVASALAAPLAAQSVCRPPASSNEAKTLATFSVPLAFGPATAPEILPGLRVGLEGAYLPKVDPATATPTICRPGQGPLNTDLLFALPRPRIGVPLPFGLALQSSWIPPVRVAGAKANLFGFSLGKSFGRLDGLVAAIRAHGTFGSIRGPITCDDAALADPTSECFQGTRSDDKYSPNIFGADLSLGWTMAGGRLRPYLGGGYNRLEPRFQVSFTNQVGTVDSTRIEVNLNRGVVFGGATGQLTDRLGVAAEVYAVPADAVTARLVVQTAIGPN
jgi:hypothetical protein